MRLVDTSCWTQVIRRRGDPVVRAVVQALLDQNEAAWYDPVRLELWNGVGTDWDRTIMQRLEATVPVLAVSGAVWTRACELAYRARSSGLNVPANDVLIFACAQEYGVGLEHNDRHYPLLAALR